MSFIFIFIFVFSVIHQLVSQQKVFPFSQLCHRKSTHVLCSAYHEKFGGGKKTALILHPTRGKLFYPPNNNQLIDYRPEWHPSPPLLRQENNVFLHSPNSRISNAMSSENLNSMSRQTNSVEDTQNLVAVIEGSGPYLCILRSSSDLDSGFMSVFVRDVGYYRCHFHGGARRMGPNFFGAGFYQCVYQRPGVQLRLRQGVGQYFCFFQGIRFARGFLDAPGKPPKEKRSFLYYMARVNYNVMGPTATPIGQFQLLGIYNYGPEGTGRNFGLVQVLESFNVGWQIHAENITKTTLESGDPDEIVTKRSSSLANQLGQYQYHFTGTEFDRGKADRFQDFIYNFIHAYGSHLFTFLVALYEFSGQGQGLLDDHDFVQLWGLYKYTFELIGLRGAIPANFQAIVMAQFDFLRPYSPTFLEFTRLSFIQVILLYDETFEGFRASDTCTVTLTGAYQVYNKDEVNYSQDIENGEEIPYADFVLGILQIRYVFAKPNLSVNGFVQFAVIYQQYLEGEKIDLPPGYFQIIGQYSRSYTPLANIFGGDIDDTFTWTCQGIVEYVFPDEELFNGFVKLQLQYVIDTTDLTDWISGGQGKPSSITFLGLHQCIWFGMFTFHSFCYIQLYAFFKGDITAPWISGNTNTGQSLFLVQFYQEV